MTERSQDKRILARWKVDAEDLREFLREQRLQAKRTRLPAGLLKEYEAAAQGPGIEVVFREKAIFVGKCRLSNMFDDFRVHDTWMHFLGDEGYQVALPMARGGKKEAESVAAEYRSLYEQVSSQAARAYAEERARPTLNNRLLSFVEARFVWILLGFFFVFIPLLLIVLDIFFGNP